MPGPKQERLWKEVDWIGQSPGGDMVPLECPLDIPRVGHRSLGTDPEHGPPVLHSGAAGLGLWHLLSCLQAPVLREPCSVHARCFPGQEKPPLRTERGSTFMTWGLSHPSSHKNPSTSHSWSPV